MDDARLIAAVRLMNAVAKAAYQIRPELGVAVATKIVQLCLKHGNTADCAIGYMVFGAVFLGGVMGRHRTGYEFGRLALTLVERHQNRQQRAEVHFSVGYFATSWLKPASEAEALWRTAFAAGVDSGDLFHTGCAAAGIVLNQHLRGLPFDRVIATSDELKPVLERAQLDVPIGVIDIVGQTMRNLRGQTRNPLSLGDRDFDEQSFRAALPDWGMRHFAHIYHLCKMQTLYLWGLLTHDCSDALEACARGDAYLKEIRGLLHSAEHHWYRGMILTAVDAFAGRHRSRRHLRRARKDHDKLYAWATQCPENFAAKECILAAELHLRQGHRPQASTLYDAAIRAAEEHDAVHVRALAHQRKADLLRKQGSRQAATTHLEAAVAAYEAWGASAYARALAATAARR